MHNQNNGELSALYSNMVAPRFFKDNEPINNKLEFERLLTTGDKAMEPNKTSAEFIHNRICGK